MNSPGLGYHLPDSPERDPGRSTSLDRPSNLRLVLTVLAPFAGGYFLSYLFRAINAVVAPNLVRDIGLTASELGLLTAAYLVAFALFQLPLGLLLDRYGPRRVQTALLLTTALGSLLFAFGSDATQLTAARALIGLGLSGGLMAGFKAVVLWYPKERHALANACIMSFGGVGMIVATVPAEITVQAIGWRGLFLQTAALTAVIALLLFFIVPERRDRPSKAAVAQQMRDILDIYRDSEFWRLAPLIATTAGTHIAIHTLWAGPWFRDVGGLDRDGVASSLLLIAVAFLVGSLLAGVTADFFARRGISQLHVMLAWMGCFMLSQIAIIVEWLPWPAVIWLVFGMSGQVAVLAYPHLAAHFGAALSGRAQTATNLILFLSAFLAQYMIGWVIDRFPVAGDGGYDPASYRWGFGVLFVLQVLAMIWYLLPRHRDRRLA